MVLWLEALIVALNCNSVATRNWDGYEDQNHDRQNWDSGNRCSHEDGDGVTQNGISCVCRD